MGCGSSKDDVNTQAQGKGKVGGASRKGNVKNQQQQDFSAIVESDDVTSTERKPKSVTKLSGQKNEGSKGGKGRVKEAREPVNEKGYKKRIREQLRQAATHSDIEELEHAIAVFEKNKLEDNGDHSDAIERLQFLYLRKELRDAILRRHPGILDKAIDRVESSEYVSELSQPLDTAKRLREHLTELDQYRHDILEMDQSTISEIRSYHHPPDGVHEVMMGTYMLLGYDEEKLRDWTDVQCLLGRYGKESLIREVRNADTININSKTSQRVLKMQSKFSLEQIRGVSNGAATFYVWNTNMANKSDKDRQQEQQPSQTPTPGKQSGKTTPAPKDNKQTKPNSNKTQPNTKDKNQPPPKAKADANPKDKNQQQSKAKDKNPPQPKKTDKNQANANPKDKNQPQSNAKNPAQANVKDKNPAPKTVEKNQPTNPKDKNPTQPNAKDKNQPQPKMIDKTQPNANPKDKSPAQANTKDKTQPQPKALDKNQPNANQKDKNPAQPNAKDKNQQPKTLDKNQPNSNPKDKTQVPSKAPNTKDNKQPDSNKNPSKANASNNINQVQKNSKSQVNSNSQVQPNPQDKISKPKSDSQQNTTDRKKTKG